MSLILVAGFLLGTLQHYCHQTLAAADTSYPVTPPAGKVSIIIPAYNEELYIERTLQCILAQNVIQQYSEMFEIIVVDNESQDRTGEVARQYATVITAPRGKLNAKNAGASAASGDILVFVDADGTMDPNWLNLLIRHFHDPNVVAVGGAVHEQKDVLQTIIETQLITIEGYFANVLCGSNQAVRKEAFFAIGGFPVYGDQFDRVFLREAEEVGFCLRLKQVGKVVFDTQATAYFSARSLRCHQCQHSSESTECSYCTNTSLKPEIMFGRG